MFSVKNNKKLTQITHALMLYFYSIFYTFSNFLILSELHNLILKLCYKKYNKIDFLHWIVAPQLGGGW
jgi:hypothetical protein